MGKKLSERLSLRPLGTAVAMSGLLTIGFASLFVGSTGAPALAVTACTAPSATGLNKNINTDQGCDVAAGTANYPITGFISYIGASASTTYTLEDVYQTLPDSSAVVYSGAYSLVLSCTTGSATNGSYTVAAGPATYPTPPSPAPTGTQATLTTDGSGNAVCSYSLTVGTAPAGDFASSRNDLWAFLNGTQTAHVATVSVKPPTVTPPSTTTTTAPPETTTTVGETTTTVGETTTTVGETTTTVGETTTTVGETTTTAAPTTTTAAPTTTTAAPTTTVAPTVTTLAPTTTVAPTTTAPPTTLQASVLPAIVAAPTTAPPSAPQVQVLPTVLQKSQLPFTGSNTRSMLLIAGLLLVVGGITLAGAQRRPEEGSSR